MTVLTAALNGKGLGSCSGGLRVKSSQHAFFNTIRLSNSAVHILPHPSLASLREWLRAGVRSGPPQRSTIYGQRSAEAVVVNYPDFFLGTLAFLFLFCFYFFSFASGPFLYFFSFPRDIFQNFPFSVA